MKILRIKFQNLNSLPTGDVDLEHGPLAQAGIFAITGPTGAGKSTILDAITLALYGRAARYGSEPNPENMMSRHTGECQAEVLFEVPRGRFTATWQRWRTRRRADGNLQPARRYVTDSQGIVLAQNVTESERLIEELTGLDYPRFLRSVLLAQGEFAQFLKADKDARAELLESLTGTQIYSDLSILTFREFTTREQALALKQGALSQIVLLAEDERTAKTADIDCLAAQLSTLVCERDALSNRVQQGQQLATLVTSETDVIRKLETVESAKSNAAPDLGNLARHRVAQPFFPDLQTLEELLRRAVNEAVAHNAAKTAAIAAQQRLACGSHAAHAFGEALISSANATLSDARTEQEKRCFKIKTVDDWLGNHAADKALDGVLAGFVEQLAELANARRQWDAALREGALLAKERETSAGRLAKLQATLNAILERERAVASEAKSATDALSTLLKGRTTECILGGLARLSERGKAFEKLRAAMEKRDAAAAEGLRIADEETALTADIETARTQKTATKREAESQEKLLELTRKNLALLEQIASYEDQRSQLAEGEPCPLCGSQEHPFAQPGAQASASIQEAKRNLATAKLASATARKEAQIAADTLASTEGALKGVQKRRDQMRQERVTTHEVFVELAEVLRIFTSEALDAAVTSNDRERKEHEALTIAIRSAETRTNSTALAYANQKAEVATARETISGEQNALSALDERIALNLQTAGKLQTETAARAGELGAALEPFALALPEPGAEAQTRTMLEERRRAWQAQTAERVRLDGELKQAVIRIDELERRTAELGSKARKLAVLPEVPVSDQELVDRFRKEWKTLEDAETTLGQLRSAVAETVSAVETAGKRREAEECAAKLHSAAMIKSLAGSPFADADALRLARLPDAEVIRIEKIQADLETQRTLLTGQLDQVRSQARTLRAAGAPEREEAAAVDEARKVQETRIAETGEKRTTLRNELAKEQENRSARENQAKALEEDRSLLAVWEQLKRLIGSHDGARFRQFAQGLSLDLLVRHANRHLHRLSERYELRRVAGGELMLEIIDLHQASVARPMLSLSGGESFLASLALALGLSDLAGRNVRIDSLFIDEGFGSLDAGTLDMAVAALDSLRLNNKTVGVISHVELLKERIPIQIRVEKLAGGVSVLRVPEG